MFDIIFEQILRFVQNTGLLIEAYKATETWTIGKTTMALVVFTWVAGVICFVFWYLGKKILRK